MKFRALATKGHSYSETGNKERMKTGREGNIREDNIWGKDKSKQENVGG